MRQFVWHESDSFLHRLNPLTKLALSVPVAVLASLAEQPLTPLVVAAVALLTARYLGSLPWGMLLRSVGFTLLLGLGMFWTGLLFYAGAGSEPGAPQVWIGVFHVPTAAVVYSVTMIARLLAIFTTSMLFVLTTDPVEFVLALIQQGRLPYRVGYAVFAAYRFMPLLHDELDNIRAAHQIRGALARPGPFGRLRQVLGYAIPLLAIAVRRAERVALAMDSRGFGALPERTYFRTTSFHQADIAFAICSLGVLVVTMLFAPTLWRNL